MRLSRYFLPTLKETPAEAQIVSHRLMLRAGMIRQASAGIYSWLPAGLRVLKKIEAIVREEQEAAGAQEILMPTIQSAELWRESGRYDDYGEEMLRIRDRRGHDLLYGPTNEEIVTDIVRQSVRSYRDLPLNLFHIQWKFRDEIRPRFGVMRGREFLMKDGYSFDIDHASWQKTYRAMIAAYLRTFARMGLVAVPVRAETGAIGGQLSHEFHIFAQTGESDLYYDRALTGISIGELGGITADSPLLDRIENLYAAADDMHDPGNCPVTDGDLMHSQGIEVGHIFGLGTKYSKIMGATVTTRSGDVVPMEMGCYGIGVSRLVGAIIEANHDDRGIVWPEPVAPFGAAVVNLKTGDTVCDAMAEDMYARIAGAGADPVHDDREERAGIKFADMDLLGAPWQVVIGPRAAAAGQVELKHRRTGETHTVSPEDAISRIESGA